MENAHSIAATAGDTEVIIACAQYINICSRFMGVILLMKCMQVILIIFVVSASQNQSGFQLSVSEN